MADAKIPHTVSFTGRQARALKLEGDRLGVAPAEVLRRLVDGWIDSKPGLAQKLYAESAAR